MGCGRGLQFVLAWSTALLCLLTGLYIGIENTVHFFSTHNYFISPFADDILDNAHFTYPIVTGQESIRHIFDPFVDHRVVIERLQEIFDFILTNGMQPSQPYKLSVLLWLNVFIFIAFVIKPNKALAVPEKWLLSGIYCICIFAGISVNNYVSSMQITWPIILLFTLITLIFVTKYCEIVEQDSKNKKAYIYILLVGLFVNLVLYTFNIGLVLWPVLFLVLVKRRCLRPHFWIWSILAFLTYYYYISRGWPFNAEHGRFTVQYAESCLYLFRIVSLPFIKSAFYAASISTIVVGSFVIFLTIACIILFLKMKKWSNSDTIIFSYLIFSFIALLLVSLMRLPLGHNGLVEWRFLTCGTLLISCLLISVFIILNKFIDVQPLIRAGLCVFSAISFLIFFVPNDIKLSGGTYDLGFYNQVYISEAVGIPFDKNFMEATKIYQTSGVLDHHLAVINIQKKYKKGPFSLWPSQYINHNLHELNFKEIACEKNATLTQVYDYRINKSNGVLINVLLKNYKGAINNTWDVLFTNVNNKIVGFALSSPYLQPLWRLALNKGNKAILWRGAINTGLLKKQRVVTGWAIQYKDGIICKLGALTIFTAPTVMQRKPTWVFEKANHFGMEEE